VSLPRSDQAFVQGLVDSSVGAIPQVSTELTGADHWGTFKARWGVGRMHYQVDPGLYAVGKPDAHAPVLVTANYKMSFDCLRRALKNRNAWILVLDTQGVNVWCAAGKGTFGTRELVDRIALSGLADVTQERTLIVPQLGAPGVSGYVVRRETGFRVVYGPIRAEDLPQYLDAGLQATPEMRQKTFPLRERAVLVPVELVGALKLALVIAPVLFLVAGLGGPGSYWPNALHYGLFAVLALLLAIVAGTVAMPLLLPWLPGRAFSVKGLLPGLAVVVLLAVVRRDELRLMTGALEIAAWGLVVLAIATYLAMNFTGSSTYTSLSGVRKEMSYAVPCQILATVAGMVLWLSSRFIA